MGGCEYLGRNLFILFQVRRCVIGSSVAGGVKVAPGIEHRFRSRNRFGHEARELIARDTDRGRDLSRRNIIGSDPGYRSDRCRTAIARGDDFIRIGAFNRRFRVRRIFEAAIEHQQRCPIVSYGAIATGPS